MLGVAIYHLAHALGIIDALGVGRWYTILALLVAGFVLAPTRAAGRLWMLAGAMVTLLFVVTFTPVVAPLARVFVRNDAPNAPAAPPVDAVVVLSGGVTREGLVRGPALDRLLSATRMLRTAGTTQLALSVVTFTDRGGASSELDQRDLVARLAPGATLHLVRDVHSTRDEALLFAALGRTNGWRRVMVITSPLHTRRACGAIERAGLAVQCVAAEPRDYPWRQLRGFDERRQAFADVVYETAATALYRIRGWL